MSNFGSAHLDEERLLRYADGELPPREAGEARRHLEVCWACRVELERLQRAVSDCVEYRRKVLQPYLPPPPAPWRDLSTQFAEADADLGPESWRSRAMALLGAALARPARWAPVVVTVLLLALIVFQIRKPATVQAAELLRQAIAAAEGHTMVPRKIHVRTGGRRVTRMVGEGASTGEAGWESLANIAALFLAAGYNWDDPLSPRSYLEWHQQLADRREDVRLVGDEDRGGRSCYQIRTVTGSGALLEATLLLKRDDLRPVKGLFLFRNRELVEVEEAGEAADLARDHPARSRSEIAPAARSARGQAPAPPTAGEELQVIAALHRLGADLGEPVEVRRTETAILVTGSGIPLPRRRELESALRALPRVEVRFTSPPAVLQELPPPGPRSLTVTPEATALQIALEKYLGGRTFLDRFADEALEQTDALVSRAHALRRLDERFPPRRVGELDERERDLLRSIRRNHAETLAYKAAGLERQMRPALTAAGAEETPERAPGEISAVLLVDSAQRLERLIAVLLGGAAGSPVTPSEALSALAELRASSRVYLERITIEDRN